jgi:hypothetical protein
MAMEDVVQDAVTVDLDKRRRFKLVVRGWRALLKKYGNVSAAFDALRAITPHKDAEGNDVPIYRDEVFFETLTAWTHACLLWEAKDMPLEEAEEILNGMQLNALSELRIAIWATVVLCTAKARDDADPTTKTA